MLLRGKNRGNWGGRYYIFFTLNSFCFRSYILIILLGLIVYIKAKTYYILAHNLALLAILISVQLISTILYSRYNSRFAAVAAIIKVQAGRAFFYILWGPNGSMVSVNQLLNQRAPFNIHIFTAWRRWCCRDSYIYLGGWLKM